MSSMDELRAKLSPYRGKAMNKETRDQLAPTLRALLADPGAAEKVSGELANINWTDAVELLSNNWSDIAAPDARNVFVRTLGEGKDDVKTVNTAKVALAASILSVDQDSSFALLDAAFSSARGRYESLRQAFSRYWLRSSKGGAPPYERLTWETMSPLWRREFVKALGAAAKDPGPVDRSKHSLSPSELRQRAGKWLEAIASAIAGDGDDRALLSKLSDDLLMRPAARSPHAAETAGSTGELTERNTDGSPAAENSEPRADTAAVPVGSHPDVSAPPEPRVASDAVRPRSSTQPRGSGQRQLRNAAKHLAQLALDIESQLNQEADAVQARLGEFQKRIDFLETELSSAQNELRRAQKEIENYREKLSTKEEAFDRMQEARDAAESRANQTDTQMQTLRADLADISGRESEARAQLQAEKDNVVKERDLARREAQRVMGEKIAQSLEEEIRTVQEMAKNPASNDAESFLRRVVNEMIERLRTQGVPL
jgi:flagellin-like hook-associated protein FlgL